jgi:hypothetical protein
MLVSRLLPQNYTVADKLEKTWKQFLPNQETSLTSVWKDWEKAKVPELGHSVSRPGFEPMTSQIQA